MSIREHRKPNVIEIHVLQPAEYHIYIDCDENGRDARELKLMEEDGRTDPWRCSCGHKTQIHFLKALSEYLNIKLPQARNSKRSLFYDVRSAQVLAVMNFVGGASNLDVGDEDFKDARPDEEGLLEYIAYHANTYDIQKNLFHEYELEVEEKGEQMRSATLTDPGLFLMECDSISLSHINRNREYSQLPGETQNPDDTPMPDKTPKHGKKDYICLRHGDNGYCFESLFYSMFHEVKRDENGVAILHVSWPMVGWVTKMYMGDILDYYT